MDGSIKVVEVRGVWSVEDGDGGSLNFETREEAMEAATLLGESTSRPVEPPASDGTASA
jgi:hypothetical protein